MAWPAIEWVTVRRERNGGSPKAEDIDVTDEFQPNVAGERHIETPLEEVMNAEMISYPNTKLMCSANVDGSAAAVMLNLLQTADLDEQELKQLRQMVNRKTREKS